MWSDAAHFLQAPERDRNRLCVVPQPTNKLSNLGKSSVLNQFQRERSRSGLKSICHSRAGVPVQSRAL